MKKRSRTRWRRRRPLWNTRRFQIFWWWGPTPCGRAVNNNTDLSTAEFIRHVPPPAALQAPPLLLYRLRPSPGCSHMFLLVWRSRTHNLLLLHRHYHIHFIFRTQLISQFSWMENDPAGCDPTLRSLSSYLLYISNSSFGLVPVSTGQDHSGSPPGQVQRRGFTDAGVSSCRKQTVTKHPTFSVFDRWITV